MMEPSINELGALSSVTFRSLYDEVSLELPAMAGFTRWRGQEHDRHVQLHVWSAKLAQKACQLCKP